MIRLGFEDGIQFCYGEGPRFKSEFFRQEESGGLWIKGGKILGTPLDLKFEGHIYREGDLSFKLSPSEMTRTSKSGGEVTLKFDDAEGDLHILVNSVHVHTIPESKNYKFRSRNA
jgi:hypothetical protein